MRNCEPAAKLYAVGAAVGVHTAPLVCPTHVFVAFAVPVTVPIIKPYGDMVSLPEDELPTTADAPVVVWRTVSPNVNTPLVSEPTMLRRPVTSPEAFVVP